MIAFDDEKGRVLFRGINIDKRYFWNFNLAALLEGFENCEVVTITVKRPKDRLFATVTIDGVENDPA